LNSNLLEKRCDHGIQEESCVFCLLRQASLSPEGYRKAYGANGNGNENGNKNKNNEPYNSVLDITRKYYTDLSKLKIINKKEGKRLGKLAKEGDKKAKKNLIHGCLRFVVSIANEYTSAKHLTLLDLINVGNIGLMKAVKKYDHEKGSITLYADWWIRQEIKITIQKNNSLIQIPITKQDTIKRIKNFQKSFHKNNGRKATVKEISANFNIPEKKIIDLLKFAEFKECSIENLHLYISKDTQGNASKTSVDGHKENLINREWNTLNPEHLFILKDELYENLKKWEQIHQFLKTKVIERDYNYFFERYDINNYEIKSFKDIGRKDNFQKQTIKAIENACFKKLVKKISKKNFLLLLFKTKRLKEKLAGLI